MHICFGVSHHLLPCHSCCCVQFLCCELVALQQHAQLQPLCVIDAASAVWRLGVAATLDGSIAKLQQVSTETQCA
jgi:hypothetical protein